MLRLNLEAMLIVQGTATLAGSLVVIGNGETGPGGYALLMADNPVVTTFDTTDLPGGNTWDLRYNDPQAGVTLWSV